MKMPTACRIGDWRPSNFGWGRGTNRLDTVNDTLDDTHGRCIYCTTVSRRRWSTGAGTGRPRGAARALSCGIAGTVFFSSS